MDKYLGKCIDARYEIREVIGVGGTSVVYKAYDNVDDKIVAVKILKDEFCRDEEFVRRFKNESKAVAILSHPNIVKVYDVGFGKNIKYIVIEYIEGITLKKYIENHRPLDWNLAVHFIRQILQALEHAHSRGIIHRDIKPQNIMLLKNGQIKVMDFGIARFSRGEATITDKAIGSVHYISPEQAKGGHIDKRADLYSVGVMMYEMLTGVLPFESDSAVSVALMQLQKDPKLPREINPSIPRGLEDIVMKAMEKNVERRYQSSEAMLADLEKFTEDPTSRFRDAYYIDEPTKYVPKVNLPEEKVQKRDEIEELAMENIEPAHNRRRTRVLAAIGGSLLLVICIFFVISAFGLLGAPSYDMKCPDLSELNYYNEIKTNKEYAKLNIVVEKTIYDDSDKGVVLDQNPKPGKTISSNDKINITISSGPQTVEVPDVKDFASDLAVKTLETKGLLGEIVQKYDDTVTANYVISTSPASGEKIPNGSKVTVYVSLGQVNSEIRVPYLINLNVEAARTRLTECGFTGLGNITEKPSSKPKGVVLSQSETAGGMVSPDTKVDLVISNGLADSVSSTITINLPDDDRTVILNLFKNGESVYESSKIKLSAKKSIDIPVDGTGTASFSVTFTGDGLNSFEYMTFNYDFTNKRYSNMVSKDLPSDEPATNDTTSNTTSATEAHN